MSHQQLNEDSLQANDLIHLVDRIFEVDNYKSKMGDDADVVVLSFTVESRAPAEDLVGFLEKGYNFVLDADMSPGELEDGKYRVFVELQRTSKVSEQISDMLYGMSRLTGIDDFKFRYHKSFDSLDAVQEKLEEVIPRNPRDYTTRMQEQEISSYENFFSNSMLESVKMQGNTIEFKKIYATPLKFKYLQSGSTTQVLESVEDRVAVGMKDMADVMFLTKYIGNYNITKLGNKFMFENKGHAIILEKINEFYI
jgi:hypothetical protein